MSSRRAAFIALWIATAIPPLGVRADEPPFGSAGQWLLGGSAGGSYHVSRTQAPDAPDRAFQTEAEQLSGWLAPSAQRFVTRDFAVGAAPTFGASHLAHDIGFDVDTLELGANALLSWHAGLGEHTFLLPQLSIGATYLDRSLSFPNTGSEGPFDRYRISTNRALYETLGRDLAVLEGTLFVPLAYAPARGLFFGLGPYVRGRYALTGELAPGVRSWMVSIGIASVIGTWL